MCQNRKRFQPTIVSKALLIKTKTFSTRLSLQTGSLIKLPWEDLETQVRKGSELSAKKIEEMFLKAFVGFGTSNEPSLKKSVISHFRSSEPVFKSKSMTYFLYIWNHRPLHILIHTYCLVQRHAISFTLVAAPCLKCTLRSLMIYQCTIKIF